MKLALTMIARNESQNLRELLPLVLPYVDEVVVGVDDSSTDDTLSVALELCDKPGAVIVFPHDEFACKAHNRVQALVNSEWTLMLDADERPNEELLEWIRNNLDSIRTDAVLIQRENLIEGQPHPERPLEWHTRLFRSDCRYVSDKHQFIDLTDKKQRKAPQACRILHDKDALRQRRSDARVASYDEVKWGGRTDLRLNIGSGNVRLDEDIINIDGMDYPAVDVVWDFTPKMGWDEHIYPYPGHIPFPDGCAKEVFCHHVIEHFSYHHTSDFVRELVRLLKVGGRIEISTPDFEALVDGYKDGRLGYLQVIQKLYGGQNFPLNHHYNCIDYGWIKGQLIHYGCENVKRLPARPGVDVPFAELRVEATKCR